MSSGGGGKSPGKGGKSLELMQKRMQIQQQQNQQQAPGGVTAATALPPPPQQQQPQQQQLQQQQLQQHPSQSQPIQSSMGSAQAPQPVPMAPPLKHQLPQGHNVITPLDPTQPVPQQPAAQQINQVVSSSKPKGKDFSLMSIQALKPVPPQHPPPPALPSPRQQPPQTVQAAPVAGKPKGKDFSAMASRMTPDSRARAAAMQAGARQAAGLPPLDRPTATSVTTTPPTIPAPRYSPAQMQQQQLQQGGVAYMGTSSSGSAPVSQSTTYIPRNSDLPSSSSMPQRLSPLVASGKPTPAPTPKEGILASPHMAPLVGPRVRDLVRSLDPSYTIDAAAEKQVLELVDDFLEKVCKQSIRLASHRNSKTMDVQDVQFILAKQWGITIPGLGPPGQKSGMAGSINSNKRKVAPSSPSIKTQKTEEQL